MLMGEHAVVYGKPALVTALSCRLTVSVKKNSFSDININARDLEYKTSIPLPDLYRYQAPRQMAFLIKTITRFYSEFNINDGLDISIKSQFSPQLGLGSSAAVTVAAFHALSVLFQKNLSKYKLFELAYRVVSDIQGKTSGFDVASSIFGGTICYQMDKKIVNLKKVNPPFLVVYTGVKADTGRLVNKVSQIKKKKARLVNRVFAEISALVEKGKKSYVNEDWSEFGRLMGKHQHLLFDLGVSTFKIDKLIDLALKNGALGAKLSGAGGGDCIIVLVEKNIKEKLAKILALHGGYIIDVDFESPGVSLI